MLKNTFYPTVFMTVALLLFALLVVPRARRYLYRQQHPRSSRMT